MWLRHKNGTWFAVQTRCKRWKCRACRDSTKLAVLDKIVYGISTLPNSWLLTLTFRFTSRSARRHAPYVSRKWAKLLWTLKRKYPTQWSAVEWFKVPELTKNQQPHLHVVLGGLNGKRAPLSKQVSAEWERITGDSYIIDLRPSLGPYGVAAYLGKYLTKQMGDRTELANLGFIRRWSRSRGWPSFRPTLDNMQWTHTRWVHKDATLHQDTSAHLLAFSEGKKEVALLHDPVTQQMADLKARWRMRAIVGRISKHVVKSHVPPSQPSLNSSRHG